MIFQSATTRSCARYASVVVPVVTLISGFVFFSRLLGDAAAGETPVFILGQLFLLTLVKYTPQLLILSTFAGAFIAMRRAFVHNEMIVWFSSGLGLHHFIKPVLLFALFPALLVTVFSLYISPWSVHQINTLRNAAVFDIDIQQIPHGQFNTLPGRSHIYFLNDRDTLFIASNKHQEVIFAQNVQRENDTAWRLESGNLFHLSAADENHPAEYWEQLSFKEIILSPAADKPDTVRPRAKSLAALSWNNRYDRAELVWRLALPLAVIILVLFALYLSPTSSRLSKRVGFLPAIVVFAVYLNSLRFMRDLVANDTLPAAAALLLPPLLLGGLMAALAYVSRR